MKEKGLSLIQVLVAIGSLILAMNKLITILIEENEV